MEYRRCTYLHVKITVLLGIGWITGGSDQVIASFWVVAAEELEGRTVKCVRAPLALDGVHFIAAIRQNEIDFPPRLVAPVADWRVLEMW